MSLVIKKGNEREKILLFKKEIEDKIKETGLNTLQELNVMLRTMFKTRRVVGISLKKTGKKVYYKRARAESI